MLQFFAELLQESLSYLELDEGYDPSCMRNVEVQFVMSGQCIVAFPEIGVQYFASNWAGWSGKRADWLFSTLGR